MKKLIAILLVVLGLLVPNMVYAQEQVCTSVYGGGVVCGAKHEPVETGLAENLTLLSAVLLISSYSLFYLSKRTKKSLKI